MPQLARNDSHRAIDAVGPIQPAKRKRSRGACEGCKVFKKKCDEARPSCARCLVAEKECVYVARPPGNKKRKGTDGQRASYPTRPTHSPRPAELSRPTLPPDLAPPSSTDRNSATPRLVDPPLNATAGPSSQRLQPDDLLVDNASPLASVSPSALSPLSRPFGAPTSQQSEPNIWFWPNDLAEVGQRALSTSAGASPSEASFRGSTTSSTDPFPSATQNGTLLESLLLSDEASNPPPPRPSLPLDQANEVIGIPYDCEPSVWRAFVESSLWQGPPQEGSSMRMDNALMEYFRDFAAASIVISYDNHGASQTLYQPLAQLATDSRSNALTQSILHLSAVHISNFATVCGHSDRALQFLIEAERRRGATLKALRVAVAAQEESEVAAPAVMLLLTLASLLRGDMDIVEPYLQQCSIYLTRLAATFSSVDAMSPLYISMEALFNIYSVFHLLATDRQRETDVIFGAWQKASSNSRWKAQWSGVTESVAGISVEMLLLLVRVHNLTHEHNVVVAALERLPDDSELRLMALETRSNAQSYYSRLENAQLWRQQFQDGFSSRTQLGHQIYKCAAQVFILSGIFHEGQTTRMAGKVAEFIRLCANIPPGTEIGCLWPWIVVASQAQNDQREATLPFIQRCQWKGSANPQLAERVVRETWRSMDDGEGSGGWKSVLREKGSPVLL